MIKCYLVPPESSSYSSISIFDTIENDIISLNSENNYKIYLLCDFNAHTSTVNEFIYINEHITRQALNKRLLEDLGITTSRRSIDKSKHDNYVLRLLSLCKSSDIHTAS